MRVERKEPASLLALEGWEAFRSLCQEHPEHPLQPDRKERE